MLKIQQIKQVIPTPSLTGHSKINVTLRPLSSLDSAQFMKWAMDDEVTSTLTWKSYQDTSQAHSFLVNIAEKHPWFKAICVDGIVVGSITFDKKYLFDEHVAEVGYVIAKEYWGKGYATQALLVAIDDFFKDNGISKVVAFVDPSHSPSQRVLEKAGFKLNGKLTKFREVKGEIKDRLFYSRVK